jgi:hypothetical protein
MAALGNKTVKRTNLELSDDEARVLLMTTIGWDALRPQVDDQQTYDRLIEQVSQATESNENLAQLKARVETLGQEGWKLAKKIIELIP